MKRRKWRYSLMGLLLAVCLVGGFFPQVTYADAQEATSLGYSIDSIIIDDRVYHLTPIPGDVIGYEIKYSGTPPTIAQLQADGYSFEIVGHYYGDANADEEEAKHFFEQDLKLYLYESTLYNYLFINVEIQSLFITTAETLAELHINILKHGSVVYSSDPLRLNVAHECIHVDSRDDEVDMSDGCYVVYTREDTDIFMRFLYDDTTEYGIEMGSNAKLKKDNRYFAVAQIETNKQMGGVTFPYKIVLHTIGLEDQTFKITPPTTMFVYAENAQGSYTYVGTTDQNLPHAPNYYLSATRLSTSSGSGGGSSSGKSSSGGGGGSRSADTYGTTTGTGFGGGAAATTPAKEPVSKDQVVKDVTAAAAAADTQASIRIKNAYSITADTLKAVVTAAGNKTVTLTADTLDANGAVQGRLYVEPSKLQERTGDLLLGVYTESAKTASIKEKFEKHFDNKIAVVTLEHQGPFGASLQIAAKVDLTGLDTASLFFYSYDKAANAYNLIPNPQYFIDGNGFLHFYTQQGGSVLITDKPLTAK